MRLPVWTSSCGRRCFRGDGDYKNAQDLKDTYGENYPQLKGHFADAWTQDNLDIDKYLQAWQTRNAGRPLAGVLDGANSISVEAAQGVVDQDKRDYDRQMKRSGEIQAVFNNIAKAQWAD